MTLFQYVKSHPAAHLMGWHGVGNNVAKLTINFQTTKFSSLFFLSTKHHKSLCVRTQKGQKKPHYLSVMRQVFECFRLSNHSLSSQPLCKENSDLCKSSKLTADFASSHDSLLVNPIEFYFPSANLFACSAISSLSSK